MGSRVMTLNRQNTYPGNNGSSDTFERVAYLCCVLYKGKRVSNPLLSSVLATALSNRGFTATANHCGVLVSGSDSRSFNGETGLLLSKSGIATAFSSTSGTRLFEALRENARTHRR